METRDEPALQEHASELKWSTPRLRLKVVFVSLLAALACYGIFQWVLWPVKVVGDSMLPGFQPGKRYFVNKLAYRSVPPQRGDVVALRAPDGDVYIKRVIGLPGDRLQFIAGRVIVNSNMLVEPYVIGRGPWEENTLEVANDEYFVMGDNRATSIVAVVGHKRIIGKLMVKP